MHTRSEGTGALGAPGDASSGEADILKTRDGLDDVPQLMYARVDGRARVVMSELVERPPSIMSRH